MAIDLREAVDQRLDGGLDRLVRTERERQRAAAACRACDWDIEPSADLAQIDRAADAHTRKHGHVVRTFAVAPRSWREISVMIKERTGIYVSYETLRTWYRDQLTADREEARSA